MHVLVLVVSVSEHCIFFFFFFNDTATTEIYPLSLHDALPIWSDRPHRARRERSGSRRDTPGGKARGEGAWRPDLDRKSTRLNSSHSQISYAVFCLKKKKCMGSVLGYVGRALYTDVARQPRDPC